MSDSPPTSPRIPDHPPMDPILVSYADTAKLLALSVRELRRLVDRGSLPCPVQIGRRKLFQLAQVRKAIDDIVNDSED